MTLLAFTLGAFVVLPVVLGLTLRPAYAGVAWVALALVAVIGQAQSSEPDAFTVWIVLLALTGGLFLLLGMRLRRRRTG